MGTRCCTGTGPPPGRTAEEDAAAGVCGGGEVQHGHPLAGIFAGGLQRSLPGDEHAGLAGKAGELFRRQSQFARGIELCALAGTLHRLLQFGVPGVPVAGILKDFDVPLTSVYIGHENRSFPASSLGHHFACSSGKYASKGVPSPSRIAVFLPSCENNRAERFRDATPAGLSFTCGPC